MRTIFAVALVLLVPLTANADQPLVITAFQATEGQNNLWTFSGTVTDSAQGHGTITVHFGGLPQLIGQTTTVQGNGSFSLTIQVPPNTYDVASAVATDQARPSNTSQTAYALVDSRP